MTIEDLNDLESRIGAAVGRDADLDRAIARALGGPSAGDAVPDYTASVDRCIELLATVLPAWHWHVGHGPRGILPYATLTEEASASNPGPRRVEASATTVPLALLHVIVKALIIESRGEG